VPVLVRLAVSNTLLFTCAIAIPTCADCYERQYGKGILVQGAAYSSCHWDCAPFDRPTLYFCIQLGREVLVGSRGADPIWMYDSSKMFNRAGHPVSVRYQRGSIWILRPDGKEMHLKEDYSNDVFSNAACSASVRQHWVQKFAAVAIPKNIAPAAKLVPLTDRSYFWVHCQFDSQRQWDVCTEWDSKGVPDTQKRELVDPTTHRGVPDVLLNIDPVTTKDKAALHLKNGIRPS